MHRQDKFVNRTVRRCLVGACLVFLLTGRGLADPVSVAHYLANEGVMVVRGETKVLFDPFMESGLRGDCCSLS